MYMTTIPSRQADTKRIKTVTMFTITNPGGIAYWYTATLGKKRKKAEETSEK